MPSSKFGKPYAVMQPPPVCKKGPDDIAKDLAFPPSILYAAVSWEVMISGTGPYAYAQLVTLSRVTATNEWRGQSATGDYQGQNLFIWHPSPEAWEFHGKYDVAGLSTIFIDTLQEPYKGGIPFATKQVSGQIAGGTGQFFLKITQ